ncbi:MAG: hypothetical protein WC455_18810 [Dehalococcoidia bacterium]
MEKRFEASFQLEPGCCTDVLGISTNDNLIALTYFGPTGAMLSIHGMNKPECEKLIKACESRIRYLEARNEP